MEFTTKIDGKKWRIVLADGLYEKFGNYGECDHPSKRGRAIRIDPVQNDEELLDTLLHEMSHAVCHMLAEEVIEQIAGDYCRAILELFDVTRKQTYGELVDRRRDSEADGTGGKREVMEGSLKGVEQDRG